MDEINMPITKLKLERYSLEVCEFCEKTFENRYDSLIHNASHIIIPLIRQNFLQCNKCFSYCTSENDLHQHIIVKHPLVIKTERLSFWDNEEERNLNKGEERAKNDTIYDKTSDKSESDVNNSVNLQNGHRDCNKKNSNLITINGNDAYLEVSECNKKNSNPITINGNDASLEVKIETKSIANEFTESALKKPSVKDCLIFENDDDLENLTNTSKFSKRLNTGYTKSNKEPQNQMSEVNGNGVSDYSKTKLELDLDDDIYTPLIFFKKQKQKENDLHYNVLTQPNKVYCRYCSAVFLTRFNLIIHELNHMRFKQKILGLLCLHCDKYIAGNYSNLTKHIDRKHSKDKYKVYCTSVCKKCGLQYRSYKHHMHNYHSSKCCNINKFVTDNQFKNHLEKCLCHSHVLSVCRQCYTMLQVDISFKCVTLGIRKTSGVLQDCKKCDKKVKEIISVKLSCKIQSKFQYWYVQDKPLSNKDRLKNIRMRLKKLNIMSKMYRFVSFLSFLHYGNNKLI